MEENETHAICEPQALIDNEQDEKAQYYTRHRQVAGTCPRQCPMRDFSQSASHRTREHSHSETQSRVQPVVNNLAPLPLLAAKISLGLERMRLEQSFGLDISPWPTTTEAHQARHRYAQHERRALHRRSAAPVVTQ